MISSVSRLQDKSSEVVESNIQRNSRGLYLSNTTSIYDSLSISKRFSQSPESNQTTLQKVQFFSGDNNTHNMIISNETRLTVAISDLVFSEGLSFNISQIHRFKKVLELARNVSKCYQPTNRKLISKDLLDVINDLNMERNLSLIEKESDIFGLLFLVEGAAISRIPILKFLVSGNNIPVAVLEIFDCQVHLVDGGGKYGCFICTISLDHIRKIDPRKSITDGVMLYGASNDNISGELLKMHYLKV